MRLVASLTSPFARKVRLLLLEKQIDCALEVDIPWNSDTAVPDYNPLGKVPVLVLTDGTALYDSRVIAEYLDALPGPKFIPEDWATRIQVRRIEALADGIADAAAAIFIERRRAPQQQSHDWIARQYGKIDRGLQALATDLGDRTRWLGEQLTLADLAVISTLGYLDLRFADVDWRTRHAGLANYMAQLASRDSVSATLPPVG